jgi:hypothetical protein
VSGAIQAPMVECDWIVMGIAQSHQGRRLADGRSLAVALAEETARYARRLDYRRLVAMVHHDHKSLCVSLSGSASCAVRAISDEYDLFAVDLVVSVPARPRRS